MILGYFLSCIKISFLILGFSGLEYQICKIYLLIEQMCSVLFCFFLIWGVLCFKMCSVFFCFFFPHLRCSIFQNLLCFVLFFSSHLRFSVFPNFPLASLRKSISPPPCCRPQPDLTKHQVCSYYSVLFSKVVWSLWFHTDYLYGDLSSWMPGDGWQMPYLKPYNGVK